MVRKAPPLCQQCDKPTDRECGRAECANRRHETALSPGNPQWFPSKGATTPFRKPQG